MRGPRASIRPAPWHTRGGCDSCWPRSRRSSSLAPAAEGRARLVKVTAPPAGHLADPGLKTYVFRFGPHEIGPYQVAKGTDVVSPPPVDGAIVGMDTRLVTRSGAEVPQWEVMLHHIVYTNGGPDGRRRDSACPQRPIFQRFYGTSEELRPLSLPAGYGYRYTERDRWRASWMVMNHQSRNRDALLEYRITVDTSPDVAPVVPLWLSVLPCRKSPDPQYSVPGGGAPGSTHYRGRSWKLPVGGRIVAMGGHMHGGGRGLTVSQPACGRRSIYTARPTYATADDPLYAVRPLLHEPDPKHISWSQSATGWNAPRGPPAARDRRLRRRAAAHARDGDRARVRRARPHRRPVRAAARRRALPRCAVRRPQGTARGRPHARDARPRRRRAADRPPARAA